MKKRILFGILMILTLSFITTGCDLSKKVISNEQFEKVANDNGLTVVDVKEQFAQFEFIKSALVAGSTEGWQVEFYTLTSKDQADSMYQKNYASFENDKDGISKNTKVEIGNYTKYTAETKSKYRVLTRVDNTLLYIDVPIKYKDKAAKIVEQLGY